MNVRSATSPRTARTGTYVADLEREADEQMKVIVAALGAIEDGTELDYAVNAVLTVLQVAFGVMKKANPSKVRSEAMTVEIRARLEGLPEFVRVEA